MIGKVGIIIQARLTSKRFPCKVIFPLFDGHTVLEMMVDELKKVGCPIVVAIPSTKPSIVLQQWCKDHNMDVFLGSEDDCTDRFLECAKKYKFDIIVRVCADTPLIKADDIKFSLERALVTDRYTEGNGCFIFTRQMLEEAWHNDHLAERREGVSCSYMGARLDYPEDITKIQNRMDVNFMELMRKKQKLQFNTPEIIETAYDMQAGISTSREYLPEYKEYYDKITDILMDEILKKVPYNIMEAGVGEGVIIKRLARRCQTIIFNGFDISQKRLDILDDDKIYTFKSELGNIKARDKSIDFMYTVHAIEPNGGREKEIIEELIRITKKRLVLIEPTYELGNQQTKDNIDKHKYCKGIPKILTDLHLDYDENFLGIGKETNQNAIYSINLE